MIGKRNILSYKVSMMLAITAFLLVVAQHSSDATTTSTTTIIIHDPIRTNSSVKCRGKNGRAMIRNNEVYLYTIRKVDGIITPQLRLYPNQKIAKSCDPQWKKPHVEIDCRGISKGAPMEYCSSLRLPHQHTEANLSTNTGSISPSTSTSNPCTRVGEKFCIPGRDHVYETCVMTNAGAGGDRSLLIKELSNVPKEGMMCCPFANGIRRIFFGFAGKKCPRRTW